MEFKASLSVITKILTAIIIVFVIAVIYVSWTNSDPNMVWKVIMLIAGILSIVIAWGYSVSSYLIEKGFLLIIRPFGKKEFATRNIRSAEKVGANDLRFSFRTFGNGGFFGYYGKYWNKRFGKMVWYATNLNNAVLITMHDGRKIVVTPDEPEKFIAALKN